MCITNQIVFLKNQIIAKLNFRENRVKESHTQEKLSTMKEVTLHSYKLRTYFENERLGGNNLTPETTFVYKYLEDGRVIETVKFRKGKLENRIIFYYNKKNQPIEEVKLEFTGDLENAGNPLKGEIVEKKVYKYNGKNRLIEIVEIGPREIPRRKSVIHYNRHGLVKEGIEYYDMENMDFKLEYSYNEKLQIVSETVTSHEENDEPTITFYEYLNEGREKISTSKNTFGEITYKIVEVFDERGNQIITKHFDGSGALNREFIFTYDEFNNRLSKELTCYEKNKIVEHLREETEYHYGEMNNWKKAICYAEEEEYSSVIDTIPKSV